MQTETNTPSLKKVAQSFGYSSAVACRGLVKEFGSGDTKVRAVRGVELDVPYGQLSMLIGPSGCGKTTLISMIAGLLDPSEGELAILGADRRQLRGNKLTKFRAENIGFVFQQYNLIPSLTAAENAAVPLFIAGMARAKAVAKASEVLSALGLGEKVKSLPAQLSGGQQQRIAIARALVHEPKLLLCDEPTAALDATSGRTVMDLIKQVAVRHDRAVIVVTHDNRVFDFGDRLIHMSDGLIEKVESGKSRDRHLQSAEGQHIHAVA